MDISAANTNPGARVRAFRDERDISLDEMADMIAAEGVKRPSAAKLSRIERIQPIALDILPAISKITGIPREELRPELAEVLRERLE